MPVEPVGTPEILFDEVEERHPEAEIQMNSLLVIFAAHTSTAS